jgi:quercetin dioxygenase-like cupin family protein
MLERWDEVEERTIVPGMHGRFIHSGRMTFALWRIEEGARLPLHSHPHEQVVHVRSGELELVVDGVRHLLVDGTVFVIAANVPHEGRAITEVIVMDAFAPVREDYREGGKPLLAAALEK